MLLLNGEKIPTGRYPNKELKLKEFAELLKPMGNILEFKYEFDDDYLQLQFVKFHIDEFKIPVKLFFWYFPYGRMDRQVEDDLCTLKYVCKIIRNLNFEEVIVMDPHSKETLRQLRKYGRKARAIYPIRDWLPHIMEEIGFSKRTDCVVVPDKGAKARYGDMELSKCVLHKVRDTLTKEITDIRLVEGTVFSGAKCIIVDDICAKGSTALRAASVLKEAGASELFLVVSHLEKTALDGNVLSTRKSPFNMVYASTSCMKEMHPKVCYMPVDVQYYANLQE